MIGHVYEIINADSSIRYVGSTYKTIARRWSCWGGIYRAYQKIGAPVYSIFSAFDTHGFDAFKIQVLFSGEFDSISEIRKKEQYYIELLPCVNKTRAYISEEERIRVKQAYAFNHKDEISEKRRRRALCPLCNTTYAFGARSHHFKTKKHQHAIVESTCYNGS